MQKGAGKDEGMVSIIVPVYNVEKYLDQAVRSVLGQTCPDWELLLINDGSSDGSLAVCRKYEKMDSRIRAFDKENGGVSSARNMGLKEAGGEWVTFLDGDDWLEENCLENALKETDEKTDIVCWNYWENAGTSQKRNQPLRPSYISIDQPKQLIWTAMFPQYSLKKEGKNFAGIKSSCTKLIRRRILDSELKFDTAVKIGEDALFSAMCFEKAQKVVFIDQYLYHYRMDNTSATRKLRPDIREVYRNTLRAFHCFLEKYPGETISSCYGGLAYACVARSLEKYYFHPENHVPLGKRLGELQAFLEDEYIQSGISGIGDKSFFSLKQRMVIFCIRHKSAAGLYLLSMIKNRVKG